MLTVKKSSCREFSKLILMAAGVLNLMVIVFTFIMVWRTCDLTPLSYLIPATSAEVATGTAFYYNKAKAENRLKLMRIYGIEVTEKNFDGKGGSDSDRPDGSYLSTLPLDYDAPLGVPDSVYQAQG